MSDRWSAYEIRHVATGISYIGRTRNFTRCRRHATSELNRQLHHCEDLQAAWDFYGPNAFCVQVIAADMSSEQSVRFVAEAVTSLRERDCVYNAAIYEVTPESVRALGTEKRRRAASERKGVKNGFYGRKHASTAKERMSSANKGRAPVNRRPVAVKGVVYPSIREASQRTAISPSLLAYPSEIQKVAGLSIRRRRNRGRRLTSLETAP